MRADGKRRHQAPENPVSERTTWIKLTALNFMAEAAGQRIELSYEAAGFQSRWAVLLNNTVVGYRSDFMEARNFAHQLLQESQTARIAA
jgi:hypothetical protein